MSDDPKRDRLATVLLDELERFREVLAEHGDAVPQPVRDAWDRAMTRVNAEEDNLASAERVVGLCAKHGYVSSDTTKCKRLEGDHTVCGRQLTDLTYVTEAGE